MKCSGSNLIKLTETVKMFKTFPMVQYIVRNWMNQKVKNSKTNLCTHLVVQDLEEI
jgi:hypothetical protein